VVSLARRAQLRAALALALALGLGLGWLRGSKLSKPAPIVPGAAQTSLRAAENPCETLTQRLCREFAEGSTACALARRETAGFSAVRCDGMLARYPQVARKLRELDVGTRELSARDQRSLHGEAPQLGSADAELTLVVFSDFQSADCARAAPLARVATNLYPERVRVVFRQYPTSKHPDAQLAAEASLAAHAQGKFWAFHDVLFANPQDLQRAALERYAAEVGLDVNAFRRDLDSRRFAADVAADIELGHKVQALDRPSVYANGQAVSVPYGVAELSSLVESALALQAQR
jgi:hypothetical protein